MPGYSTDAVLLRKIEYGDHDYIISFLTRSCGKISVIAKNAKKSVKRFSGALDLFSLYHVQCTLPKKKKDSLTILSQADLENGFVNIRYDVFKTAYASFWAELIHFWLEENKPSETVFDLLVFSLGALNRAEISKEVISLLFQIRFMDISGLSPQFETCFHCGTRIDEMADKKVKFDFKEGHLVCRKCAPRRSRYGMMVTKGTLKQLFWINHSDVQRADRIRFSRYAIEEGQQLLEAFIPFHMGREFKSLNFLRQLRQEQ
jgi:DNA repair protein RecO (recombination protein O)